MPSRRSSLDTPRSSTTRRRTRSSIASAVWEPEVQVRLWREGEIRGFDFITALIMGLGHEHDGADRIDHEALALLAALLARVFFAEIMIPGEQAGAWSATARARDLATLVELRLRAR
jgi:hypothetical protein